MPLPRPRTDFEELPYWTRGRNSELAIARCGDCGYWIHPPSPVCPQCRAWNVNSEAVSGRGRIVSFTVNHQQWLPDVPTPYVIAVVNLVEQDDLRVVARIVIEDLEALAVDLEVDVAFQDMGDWVMPYFVPTTGAGS